MILIHIQMGDNSVDNFNIFSSNLMRLILDRGYLLRMLADLIDHLINHITEYID